MLYKHNHCTMYMHMYSSMYIRSVHIIKPEVNYYNYASAMVRYVYQTLGDAHYIKFIV